MSKVNWACPCMEELYNDLKQVLNTDHLYFINTKHFATLNSKEIVTKPEPLRIEFEVKGKNGKPLKKMKRSFVSFKFCPFCGKEYGANS